MMPTAVPAVDKDTSAGHSAAYGGDENHQHPPPRSFHILGHIGSDTSATWDSKPQAVATSTPPFDGLRT
jgi:hypothetical protein